MSILNIILAFFYAYVLAGVVFAFYFLSVGAAKRDEAAHGISLTTKALLFSGSVALWLPLLLPILRTYFKKLKA
jgi:hypothetical protein